METGGDIIKANPKHSMVFIEQEKVYNDKFNFYKEQNEQLESRIQKLIEVNTDLKHRVDSLLKGDLQLAT